MFTLLNPATEFYLLVITVATDRPPFSGPALSTLSLHICRGNEATCAVLSNVTLGAVD